MSCQHWMSTLSTLYTNLEQLSPTGTKNLARQIFFFLVIELTIDDRVSI